MKKKFLATLLLFAFIVVGTVSAQIKFGVKGGLNMSNLSVSGKVIDKSNNIGFYLGPTAKISLPLTGFGLDVSALYNQYSADVTVEAGNEQITRENATLTVKQLAVPVNVRYGVGLGSLASIYAFAGPQFAFNMADDISSIDWKWKNTYLSVNVGVGVSLLKHLQASLNYNVGCGKSGHGSTSGTERQAFNAKSNAWQLGVAYYF